MSGVSIWFLYSSIRPEEKVSFFLQFSVGDAEMNSTVLDDIDKDLPPHLNLTQRRTNCVLVGVASIGVYCPLDCPGNGQDSEVKAHTTYVRVLLS